MAGTLLTYIAFQPRSGSSMTAGILAAHGVWCGTCRQPSSLNQKGFFENLVLGKYLRQLPPPETPNTFSEPVKELKSVISALIRDDGYTGGPWLLKNSVMAAKAFAVFEPVYICPVRDKHQVYDSCVRSGIRGSRLSYDELWREVKELGALISELVNEGAFAVDVNAVAAGDFRSIKTAIEDGVGIEFNDDVTAEFVDNRLWHA